MTLHDYVRSAQGFYDLPAWSTESIEDDGAMPVVRQDSTIADYVARQKELARDDNGCREAARVRYNLKRRLARLTA